MRVGIIQSNYLPWRGYFDFIASVDLFIVYDDVQFTTRDWRTRNRIKTRQGLTWMTVPVHQHRGQRICDTEIAYEQDWRRAHRNTIAMHLGRAPYVDDALEIVDRTFARHPRTVTELNVDLIRSVCRYLDIRTALRLSSEVSVAGTQTERLLALLAAVGATTYVSGPAARAYLDEARFRQCGIRLEYKAYAYADYPQLWGPFEGGVSIVDLIANCGPEARRLVTSSADNELAVA